MNHDDLLDQAAAPELAGNGDDELEVRLFGFTFDPVVAVGALGALAVAAVWLLSKENKRLRSLLATQGHIETVRKPCGCTEEVNVHGIVHQQEDGGGEGADQSAVNEGPGVIEPGRPG